ncbi:MAG: DotU family type IV/VI secretion system protein [Polyangiaceae bacterium]
MPTTDPLWFAIEDAFTFIEQQCIEARAAQLVLAGIKADAAAAKSLSAGASAPSDKAGSSQPTQTVSEPSTDRFARATDLAKDLAFRQKHQHGADVVAVREAIRKRLSELREALRDRMREPTLAYAVLFPLVIHIDEIAIAATDGAVKRWEPMQGELFEIKDGGIRFYTELERWQSRDYADPLIFEAYYFCLKDGYQGQYQRGSKRIADILSLLENRLQKPAPKFTAQLKEPSKATRVPFPWQLYVVAVGFVVLLYVILRIAA